MKAISTSNAPSAIGPYSQAIVHAGMVYTSGQIAINPSTGNIDAVTIERSEEHTSELQSH